MHTMTMIEPETIQKKIKKKDELTEEQRNSIQKELNTTFDQWIMTMDLSSSRHLERKVDRLCTDVVDRFNPESETDYQTVLRTHLMLEVWAQIKEGIFESYLLETEYENCKIGNNKHSKMMTVSMATRRFGEQLYLNRTKFMVLIWQKKDKEKNKEKKESVEQMWYRWKKKSEFPPHLCVQCHKTDENVRNGIMKFKVDPTRRLQRYAEEHGMSCTVVICPNLVSHRRKFKGITWMYKMPLKRYIFGPSVSGNVVNLCQFIGNTKAFEYFGRNLNFDQFRALHSALTRDLTLIHGPPGSGKTKCVLLPILKCVYNALHAQNWQQNEIFIRQWKLSKWNKRKSARAALNLLFGQWKETRIGIFAGSNQAIDEIVFAMMAINANPYLERWQKYCEIPISRIGNVSNMNREIATNCCVSLNAIAANYADLKWNEFGQNIERDDGDLIKMKLNDKKAKCQRMREEIYQNKQSSVERIAELIYAYFAAKIECDIYAALNTATMRHHGMNEVLKVLCRASCVRFMTANYAGSKVVDIKTNNFDFGIFDECCQIMECEQLIALNFCRKAVFIGDPKQLNATIFYHGKYKKYLVDSLFVRINKYEKSIILRKQYRMHSEISSFPSRCFYDGLLINNTDYDKIKTFHFDPSGEFKPYLFFNVVDGKEQRNGSSLMNVAECRQIRQKILCLMQNEAYLKEIRSIGIVTPYSAQRALLRNNLENECAYLKNKFGVNVDIMTVDECQGTERDVICYSCVRSNKQHKIGFLKTKSRLNVAITRAKYALWIYGNVNCLAGGDETWKFLIQDAKERNLIIGPQPRMSAKWVKKKKEKENKELQSLNVVDVEECHDEEIDELQKVFNFAL